MERLGLWGDGAAFKSFDSFLASITKRGLGKWHSFQPREQEEKKDKEGERGRNFALTPYPTPRCFFCTHLLASSSQSELLEQELTLLNWQKRCISRSLIFKIFPGASEMLAMEMKASGMYVSRGLSFRQAEVMHNFRNGIVIFCCNQKFFYHTEI